MPIKPGAKAPLIDDWQTPRPPEHYLPKCARWGTGILAATCPAVDLDIKDRELVRVLVDLAGEMLGPAPFRVGAPPKALLPFSTMEPFGKISGKWWALPGDNWRAESWSPHREPQHQFQLVLRAEPGVDNQVRALRAVLKIAGRQFGLKCLSCAPEPSLECQACGRLRPVHTVVDGECVDCRH